MNEIFDEVKTTTYKPPMTNADRIRSMTDEELADFLVTKMPGDICDWEDLMLEWLKQPVGGNE